jgi:hypothetical protein
MCIIIPTHTYLGPIWFGLPIGMHHCDMSSQRYILPCTCEYIFDVDVLSPGMCPIPHVIDDSISPLCGVIYHIGGVTTSLTSSGINISFGISHDILHGQFRKHFIKILKLSENIQTPKMAR